MSDAREFNLPDSAVHVLRKAFARHLKIETVTLYGSRALGTFKAGSDIDLTLHGQSLTVEDLLRIENDIDDLLLPYKVDLSLFEKIENPDLLAHIERVGKIFWQRR